MPKHFATLEAARDAAMHTAIDTMRQDLWRMHEEERHIYDDSDRAIARARLLDTLAYMDSVGIAYRDAPLPAID